MAEREKFAPLKLENQLCFAMYSAAHAFSAAYKPMLDSVGITYPQYLVLMVLWEKDEVTVKEIGRHLHLDSGTLTPLLKRLEKSGFLRRRRDALDERQVRVALTQKGLDVRTSALGSRNDVVCALGGSEKQIQSLKNEIGDLIVKLRSSQN